LAYCLNLHAAADFEATLAGLRAITLPLRDRLADGRPFGVGVYLPAAVAGLLASPAGERDLDELAAFLAAEGLDPFTFNAFPHGRFHEPGLKRGVFRPAWDEPEREAFTRAVALVAARLNRADGAGGHVSISTHTGGFGPLGEERAGRVAAAFARSASELARLEAEGAPRMVLALEAEPRANAGDTRALAAWMERLRGEAGEAGARHLGVCLDACHSAVEFEPDAEAWAWATRSATPLGKLQFSSALALERPAVRPCAREALLAMEEPVFLHQVTGSGLAGELRVDDLGELAAALASPSAGDWLACDQWRCHFHVPVDVAEFGAGLATTRAHADALLSRALSDPDAWGSRELHVEIETYTWDLLPRPSLAPRVLVDGLEREYRHVLGLLVRHGWERAS
jgi:sugar phosphate isomerase/epimerase